MIVGTAGHIDHGKTTLTRALTGVDTDRLKEEKARGISIELGYAYLDLADDAQPGGVSDSDGVLGIIDVPGHERLVHTMASGATGIDYALLVVAADDGVMPQTREHLAILALLGINAGVIAVTKVDRVDAVRCAEVHDEIQALLAETPLQGALIFDTAANDTDDAGTKALLAHLKDVARQWRMRRDDGLFRLAVDRVFTLSGQGTVVTGTVHAGRAAVGDTLFRVPERGEAPPLRIRSIHAQNRPAATGRAGQRVALNLAGVERDALQRGDWIVDARLRAESTRIDCEITLLDMAGAVAGAGTGASAGTGTAAKAGALAHWTPLHVHVGSAHRLAHLALLQGGTLAPGASARVQLVFDTPIHTVPGDRFIVRNAQANRTIGGGRVLDPFGPARRRGSVTRMQWLDALLVLLDTGSFDVVLRHSADGVSGAMLMHLTGRPLTSIALPADAVVLRPRGEGADQWIFDRGCWEALGGRAADALGAYHQRAPDEQGVEIARLRRMVVPTADDGMWRAAVQRWVEHGTLALSGPWLHLPGHAITLDAGEEALAAGLLPLLAAGRFDPPWVRDLAAGLSVGEDAVRSVLRKLARQGRCYQVVRDLFYGQRCIAELARIAGSIAAGTARGEVAAATFRDATGLGRKRAIQLLEFFDRVGYTRRHRDTHLLRGDSRWLELLSEQLDRAE